MEMMAATIVEAITIITVPAMEAMANILHANNMATSVAPTLTGDAKQKYPAVDTILSRDWLILLVILFLLN